MNEKFTPSELIETQERKEKHDKGQEEAQYYHIFLKSLKDKIIQSVNESEQARADKVHSGAILASDDKAFKTLLKPLKDYIGKPGSLTILNEIIKEAKKEAESAPIVPKEEFIQIEDLNNMAIKMSPKEFVEYLDKLDSSLIK